MSKLKCVDCGKTFLYAAILTTESTPTFDFNQTTSATQISTTFNFSVEKHVCPYCQSLNLDEVQDGDIVSVKSVDLADVDEWLKQGYTVHELYAKTCTLVKKAEVK